MTQSSALQELFGDAAADAAVQSECRELMNIFSVDEKDLFIKWEAYALSSGAARPKLTVDSLHDFKGHLQRQLEKKSLSASRKRPARTVNSASKAMAIGMPFLTPTHNKKQKQDNSPRDSPTGRRGGSPIRGLDTQSPSQEGNISSLAMDASPPKFNVSKKQPVLPFEPVDGTVQHSYNSNLAIGPRTAGANRIRITSHVNTRAFNYRTMTQKIVEISDTLDVQIEVMTDVIKEAYGLESVDMGNPAAISQSTIVAVGRIVPDSLADNSLNRYSMLLEASRAAAAGSRVKLNVEQLLQPQSASRETSFFPGQLVALRGSNPDGKEFVVTEVLELPLLPYATTPTDKHVEFVKAQKNEPVSLMTAAGPYTRTSDFEYAALRSLVAHANATKPDALILLGPFVDSTHPLFMRGDFTVPNTESATVEDLFADKVLPILQSIDTSVTVILVSNIRDALSNHPVFPQAAYSKPQLKLPKHIFCVPNPTTFSINDITITISSIDSVADINKNAVFVSSSGSTPDRLVHAYSQVLRQRRVYPVLPSSINPSESESGLGRFAGVSLDTAHLPLADLAGARPDVLISPTYMFTPRSVLVDGVLAINPGLASQHSSFCEMMVVPQAPSSDSNQPKPHNIPSRARVNIVKI